VKGDTSHQNQAFRSYIEELDHNLVLRVSERLEPMMFRKIYSSKIMRTRKRRYGDKAKAPQNNGS
jgi:hypothetical protein